MDIDDRRRIIEREVRRPFYVQVVTQPRLEDCWSVNLSRSGIGLVARGQSIAAAPEEGAVLTLEFQLPETGERLQAGGRIAWRQNLVAGGVDGTHSVALGVRFETMSAQHKLALARFLVGYRFRVAVRGPTLGQRERLERAIGSDAHLHVAESDEALTELQASGDVAVIVVCGTDPDEAPSLVERYATPVTSRMSLAASPRDLSARVLYYGPAHADDLVRLFNDGKLAHALEADADDGEVRFALLEACRDYGVRTEQRRVALALARALLRERARSRADTGLTKIAKGVVAESPEMRAVLELARGIAAHKVGVLLTGETGTGKEVMAHTLHDLSDRADGPFVVQDCGTLTETLLDSELFGHVKGAFTGAVSDHPGLFVLADGGTIFLDEIENTTPALQSKLLRVLETGEVRPVGGTKVRRVDVRVVCATNRDLEQAAREGRFRADLYYRLNTFPIDLPPLRDRRADIVPLARHFLKLAERRLDVGVHQLSPEAEAALLAYDWPGNVRELKNVIERAVVLAPPGRPIAASLLPRNVLAASAHGARSFVATTLAERLERVEREAIQAALVESDGVMQRAAEALGMNRITLARRAKRYGLWSGRET